MMGYIKTKPVAYNTPTVRLCMPVSWILYINTVVMNQFKINVEKKEDILHF
jgi:hypothetical protein